MMSVHNKVLKAVEKLCALAQKELAAATVANEKRVGMYNALATAVAEDAAAVVQKKAAEMEKVQAKAAADLSAAASNAKAKAASRKPKATEAAAAEVEELPWKFTQAQAKLSSQDFVNKAKERYPEASKEQLKDLLARLKSYRSKHGIVVAATAVTHTAEKPAAKKPAGKKAATQELTWDIS
jgi:valyl-tRNA synthetase